MDSVESSTGEIKAASAEASRSISAVSDISENLVAASTQSALAAIEIYNKPVFTYREQAFTILLINAWESLCKARLISNAGGDATTIYVLKPDGSFKTGRSGNTLTIELVAAIKRLVLPEAVAANLLSLIDIRDTATHLYTEPAVQQLVHSLGVAALQNYHRLLTAWFGNRLADFNFQIMPLAFTHSFKTLAMLAVAEHAADVARLLQSVADSQGSCPAGGEFYFVCEIATELRSMKKLGDIAGIAANPAASASGLPVIVKTQSLVDKYPLSYMELRAQVQAERPGTKPVQIDRIIKDFKIKENPVLAAYNFRTKALREQFEKHKTVGKNTTVIYNSEAVRFIVAQIDVPSSSKTAGETVN
jgi:Domain of unknown function (DUF3644)